MVKKIVSLTLAAVLLVPSVTVFAEERSRTGSEDQLKQRQEQREELNQQRLARLQEAADKLGIDITGMDFEEAKAAIERAIEAKKQERLQEAANKLGIDITGMDFEEAKAAIQRAIEAEKQERLLEAADKLGIDITGMDFEEAKAAIQRAIEDIRQNGNN